MVKKAVLLLVILNLVLPVYAADELISIKLSKSSAWVGDFIEATLTVENTAAKMIIIPLHFNPNVVKISDSVGGIVKSEVKTASQIRSGQHGIIMGQMLDNTTDNDGNPLYWNGAVFENPYYPQLDNEKGILKLMFSNVKVKEIKSETLITVRFIAVGAGDADIRFANNGDAEYDINSPNGAAYVGDEDVIINISSITEKLLIERSGAIIPSPPPSGGGNSGGGSTASVSPPAENNRLTYEVPEKLYENSLSRAADETGNRMVIEIEASEKVSEFIIKIPLLAVRKALSALVLETEFITPIGKIGFDNAEAVLSAEKNSEFVICKLTKDGPEVTIDGKPFNKKSLVFLDLESSHWAYQYIMSLYEAGIINGISDDIFDPEAVVTREQFAKMLVLSTGIYSEDAECEFIDLDKSHWAYKYVASAVNSGVILGYDDGSFGGQRNINRQEIAAMTERSGIYDEENEPVIFTDNDEIDLWALASVKKVQMAGIMNGMPDGSFAPLKNATRAEAAKIIFGMLLQFHN